MTKGVVDHPGFPTVFEPDPPAEPLKETWKQPCVRCGGQGAAQTKVDPETGKAVTRMFCMKCGATTNWHPHSERHVAMKGWDAGALKDKETEE